MTVPQIGVAPPHLSDVAAVADPLYAGQPITHDGSVSGLRNGQAAIVPPGRAYGVCGPKERKRMLYQRSEIVGRLRAEVDAGRAVFCARCASGTAART